MCHPLFNVLADLLKVTFAFKAYSHIVVNDYKLLLCNEDLLIVPFSTIFFTFSPTEKSRKNIILDWIF